MSLPEIRSILHEAAGKLTPQNSATLLSSILHVFFRERLQPLDPDYVSEAACRDLIKANAELYPLLERAVAEQDGTHLWACDALAFRGVDLRTRRAVIQADSAAEIELYGLLDQYRTPVSEFANSSTPLKTWNASPANESSAEFISSLRLTNTSSDAPCLLLHDLGKLIPPLAASHLTQVLTHSIFVNASGTGKTRLVLEGLCQQWGFYIPCTFDEFRLGSMDMRECLTPDGISLQCGFQPFQPWTASDIAAHIAVARDTFSRILLSRLIWFQTYLDVLEDTDSAHARKGWLLLQALTLNLDHGDIFGFVTSILSRFTQSYIDDMIADMFLDVKSRLGGRGTNLFCVLDASQYANKLYRGAFGQETTTLRELARSWENYEGLTIILTGTDIDVAPFHRPEPTRYSIYTNTGMFDTPAAQQEYITRYLPPALAESVHARALFARMWTWLRGRYVLVLLDAYIAHFTTGKPPNIPQATIQDTLSETSYEAAFWFSKFRAPALSSDRQAWFASQSALLRIILTGKDHVLFTDTCFRLAAHGVAPITNATGTEALLHEPSVVLSLVQNIFPDSGHTLGFYPDTLISLLTEPPAHRTYHLSFIPVLVEALRSDKHRLCDIFVFPGLPPRWAMERVRLVHVSRDEEGKKTKSDPFEQLVSQTQREDAWTTDSPSWLLHETRAPFCLASGFSHADLLFVLRLAHGQCLYVALTTLFKNEHVNVTSYDVQAKLSQLAPDRIFKGARSEALSDFRFGDLPRKASGLGVPPLLRLVITFPYELDINEVEGADTVAQPFAAVNTALLREYADTIKVSDIVGRLKDVLDISTGPEKRKVQSVSAESGTAKRPRTRLETKMAGAANNDLAISQRASQEEAPLRRSTRRVPGLF
ncbi:hypothetical protein BD626DRAFT_609201 [Schizophyllum amplum]|uniref:Uncharacterized protein n=1 Tax=Schizophyllum amplum TaxID=97359 RepID=A0A550CP68_9AGAR|nr:hypothetical protein BD626DRAFT_609201 [Auriculariopsis ampla]